MLWDRVAKRRSGLDLLRKNTRGLKNVEVIPAALGHADGCAKIFTSKISSGHSATQTKPGLTEGADIPVRSIASILKERGLQRLHFLKLDIEGGEPAVLRSLPDGPMTILFEVKRYILEGAGESPEALLLEMLDQGFSLRTDDGRQTIDRTSLACPSKAFDKANIIAQR